jgi:hypothetical protein
MTTEATVIQVRTLTAGPRLESVIGSRLSIWITISLALKVDGKTTEQREMTDQVGGPGTYLMQDITSKWLSGLLLETWRPRERGKDLREPEEQGCISCECYGVNY